MECGRVKRPNSGAGGAWAIPPRDLAADCFPLHGEDIRLVVETAANRAPRLGLIGEPDGTVTCYFIPLATDKSLRRLPLPGRLIAETDREDPHSVETTSP